MHRSICTNQAVHGIVKRHDEHPSIACVPGVVDELAKDEFGIMFRRNHDKDDRPRNSTTNYPDCAK